MTTRIDGSSGGIAMRYTKATRVIALALVLTLAVPAVANAGISVGGDTNWGITVETSVSTHYPYLGNTVNGNLKITYNAHFLGLPIPVTGYYINSFPYAPFARPTLLSANSPLASLTYAYAWDSYMGKYAWTVNGSKGFWGDAVVTVNGAGKTDTRGATGYFHGGTGTGHQTDENAIDYVSVR
jgi:hypothetical protein